MDIIRGMSVAPRMGAKHKGTQTVANDPKNHYVGDVEVPWNVGETVFRFKAPRDVKFSNVTVDVKEVASPTGAPVVLEAWKNGQYSGSVTLENGANAYPDFLLGRLDEIELRIVVKGEHQGKTEVKGLWFLYCVS